MIERLRLNGLRFREGMRKNGFYIYGSDDCPICPVLIKITPICKHFEVELMRKGFYTIGLAFPVIPQGTARLRIIITRTHTHEQIDGLVQAFKEIADECDFFNKAKEVPGPDNNYHVTKSIQLGASSKL